LSRRDVQRLDDVLVAIAAIRGHMIRGGLDDGMVFDAVRVRLIEIGGAIKGLSPDLLANSPEVPWAQIGGMRDRLAHRYFDTSHAIVAATVEHDLPDLETVVRRLVPIAADDDDSE
jgi:uncharacterized protein with HEPN domain